METNNKYGATCATNGHIFRAASALCIFCGFDPRKEVVSEPDFRAQAAQLIQGVSDLQHRILLKHTAAILEEIHSVMNTAMSDEHRKLCDFYAVAGLHGLVDAQAKHIEKLQARLPKDPPLFTGKVREG